VKCITRLCSSQNKNSTTKWQKNLIEAQSSMCLIFKNHKWPIDNQKNHIEWTTICRKHHLLLTVTIREFYRFCKKAQDRKFTNNTKKKKSKHQEISPITKHKDSLKTQTNKQNISTKLLSTVPIVFPMIMLLEKVASEKSGKCIANGPIVFLHWKKCQRL
jgi:hypothetical protein